MNPKPYLHLTILILQSCTHLPLPVPTNLFNGNNQPKLSNEDETYLESLEERSEQEVSQCQLLGTTVGHGGGGLAGKWAAKKNVKITAAKNRADTVVFGPEPKWHISKTSISGSYYKCNI